MADPAPTANDELLDRAIKHQVYLERFKRTETKRLIRILDELDADLMAQLAALDPTDLKGARIEQQIKKIGEISDAAVQRYAEQLQGTLEDTSEYEGGWSAAGIAAAIGAEVLVTVGLDVITPDANLLRAAVMSRPLQGKLLKDWFANLEKGRRDRLAAAIRMAAIENQTIDQLIARIRGTRANGYKDGILEISRRGAEGLARTALQHISNDARRMSYDENSSVVEKVQWVSTLDGRTTPYCRAMDGKTFPLNKGPRPPAHINCRSTTVPVLKSWADIGIEADELTEGTRASMNGQVPDTLTYDGWLRRQPIEFQDEVLGATKGELFRAGLKMEKFVDMDTQRAFTLDDLKKQEPDAWEAAFGGTTKRAGAGAAFREAGDDEFLRWDGSFDRDATLRALSDDADRALEGEAADALSDFIGFGPMSRADALTGIMSAAKLENAVKDGAEWLEELERLSAPVKAAIVERNGGSDVVTLYRVQDKVDFDPNVSYLSRGADPQRQVLSWTSSREFAESYAGVPKMTRGLYTEAEILAFEAELAEKGEVTIGRHTLRPGTEFIDPFDGKTKRYLDLYDRQGEMVTDTDSVRGYIEGENEWIADDIARRQKKLDRIVTADVKLEDALWISDRGNQAEFIVRNRPGSPQFIDETGTHRPGGAFREDTSGAGNEGHPLVLDPKSGIYVGKREIEGSGATLPSPIGKYGSLREAEAAMQRYMVATIDDKFDPSITGQGVTGSYEHLSLIDLRDNSVPFRTTSNQPNAAALPPSIYRSMGIAAQAEGRALYPPRSIDVWHNHPTPFSPLSPQDLGFSAYLPEIRDIIARDALGNVYRGRVPAFDGADLRNENASMTMGMHKRLSNLFGGAVESEFVELRSILEAEPEIFTRGDGAIMRWRHMIAERFGYHLAHRVLHEVGLYDYRVLLTGTAARLDAAFDAVLAEEGATILDLARGFDEIGMREVEAFIRRRGAQR